jgi:hypothetical protein
MFVAYLVPVEDTCLVASDGLGFLSVGSTAEEATAKLRAQWLAEPFRPDSHPLFSQAELDAQYEEDMANQRAEWDRIVARDEDAEYVLHTQAL